MSLKQRPLALKVIVFFLEEVFSSPGRSPGRAVVLPPALELALAVVSALAKCLTLKFFM